MAELTKAEKDLIAKEKAEAKKADEKKIADEKAEKERIAAEKEEIDLKIPCNNRECKHTFKTAEDKEYAVKVGCHKCGT